MKALFSMLLLLAAPVWAVPPSDNAPDWYYPEWLAGAALQGSGEAQGQRVQGRAGSHVIQALKTSPH